MNVLNSKQKIVFLFLFTANIFVSNRQVYCIVPVPTYNTNTHLVIK